MDGDKEGDRTLSIIEIMEGKGARPRNKSRFDLLSYMQLTPHEQFSCNRAEEEDPEGKKLDKGEDVH